MTSHIDLIKLVKNNQKGSITIMLHTILFDLDNTLLDFNKAERIALTKTLRQLGIEPTEDIVKRYSQINLAQWKLLEQGKLTRSQVKCRRYQLLFDEMGVACSPEKAAKIYEGLLGIGHYYIDGAQELLTQLVKEYRLYLVTNGTACVQRNRIQSAELAKYFQDIFISEEIGYNKPSLQYFTYCFEHIPGFQREEAVIVGDSLSSDIQGGKNAGIKTVWFNPAHQINTTPFTPDAEIDSLKKLPLYLQ